jgi:hypothetical protein
MVSDTEFGYGSRAARDRQTSWNRFVTDSDVKQQYGSGEEIPKRTDFLGHMPVTLVRFPDYGQSRVESVLPARQESRREKRFSAYRFLLRTGGITIVWFFGLAAGIIVSRYLPLEKDMLHPLKRSDGEYVVEELGVDAVPVSAESPVQVEKKLAIAPVVVAAVDAASNKTKSVALSPVGSRGEFEGVDWSTESSDAIAAIPLWNPEGLLPAQTEGGPTPEESPVEPFRPAAPSKTAEPLRLSQPVIEPDVHFSKVKPDMPADDQPESFVETAVAAEPKAMNNEGVVFDAVPKEIAAAAAKPMKNQIEYFEPFGTATSASRDDTGLKMTASNDFYIDAYGVDNFLDYVSPQRSEAAPLVSEQAR